MASASKFRLLAVSLSALVLAAACTGAGPVNSTPTSGPLAAPTPVGSATASLSESYAGSGWSTSALGEADRLGERFVFHCPPDGSAGVVWGSDTYTADSSVCTAAVHAGLIDFASGGDVTIEIRPGESAYSASTRNGVNTLGYGSYDASFVFVTDGTAAIPSPGATTAGATQPTGTLTYDELLTHIPPALVADCGELVHTFPGTSYGGASVSAHCVPAPSLLGSDTDTATVQYHWYDHFSKADQYFGDQLERLGDQFGEDCGVGPSHYLQQADGEFIGRVLCAGDPAEGQRIEAIWGDSRLNVVGWIAIEPGSYPDLGDLLNAAQVVP